MSKRINNCLNNETGGPNLEQMVGIGIGIVLAIAFYRFCRYIHSWLKHDNDVIRSITPGEAKDSYQCS